MSTWPACVVGVVATLLLVWAATSVGGRAGSAVRLLAVAAFVRLAGAVVAWVDPESVDAQLETAVLTVSLVLVGLATLVLVDRSARAEFVQSVLAAALVGVGAGIAGYYDMDLIPGVAAESAAGSSWEIAIAWFALGFLVGASFVFMLDATRGGPTSRLFSVHLVVVLALAMLCPWLFSCSELWWALAFMIAATAFTLPRGRAAFAGRGDHWASRIVGSALTSVTAVGIGMALVGTVLSLGQVERSSRLAVAAGFLAAAIALFFSILRSWRSRRALDQQLDRLRLHDGVAVIELDADGAVVRATDQLWVMTGQVQREEFTLLSVVHPADRPDLATAMLRSLEEGREIRRRARAAQSAEDRWFDFRILPRVVSGEPNGLVISLSDVTDEEHRRVRTEEHIRALEHEATHDPLTGLANRPHLVRHLDALMAEGQEPGCNVGILFVDVDDFKAVNNGYGHDGGDAVLIEIGRRLQLAARAEDLVARLGGDEFVVVAEQVSPGDARAIGRRILAEMESPFGVPGGHVAVTVSVGMAITNGSIEDPADLLRSADRAMFDAKAEGKNRFSS